MRAAVIWNPAAGPRRAERVRAALELAAAEGGVTLLDCPTGPEPGSAVAAAWRAVEQGCDRLIAVGGDGTVGEVADAAVRGRVPLGIMPAGTANHFAGELDLPRRPSEAAATALAGTLVAVDAGERLSTQQSGATAGAQHFVLNAGAGFDAYLVRRTRLSWKRRIGLAAYVWAGVEAALAVTPATYHLTLDGESRSLLAQMVLVANAGTILPGRRRIHPASEVDDGLFGITVFGARELHGLTGQLLRIGLQWHRGDRYLHYHSAREVTVEAEPAQPVQVDGELAGQTPLRVRVAHLGLRVAVGEGTHARLAGRRPAAASGLAT